MRQSTSGTPVQASGCVSMFILLTGARNQDYCPRRGQDEHLESKHTVMGASSDLAKSLVRTTGSRTSRTKDTMREMSKH